MTRGRRKDMIRTGKHRAGTVLLLSLCGLAGVLIAFASFLLQPSIPTGIVRNDRVTGPDGKRYRRLVEVDRRGGAITTRVRFIDLASGPSVMNPGLNRLVARDPSIVYGERLWFPY